MAERKPKVRPFEGGIVECVKSYYCGACSEGFDELEDYKSHRDKPEHVYLETWRIKQAIPGQLFCTSCRFFVVSAKRWTDHVKSEVHKKCVSSLGEIGLAEDDHHKPQPCFTQGKLAKKTGLYGLPSNFPTTRRMFVLPNSLIIGIKTMKSLTSDEGRNAPYRCESCDMEMPKFKRLTHLIHLDHKERHIRLHYPELIEEFDAIDIERKSRRKSKLNYLAYLVEQKEVESESPEQQETRAVFLKGEEDPTKKEGPSQGFGHHPPSPYPPYPPYSPYPPYPGLPRRGRGAPRGLPRTTAPMGPRGRAPPYRKNSEFREPYYGPGPHHSQMDPYGGPGPYAEGGRPDSYAPYFDPAPPRGGRSNAPDVAQLSQRRNVIERKRPVEALEETDEIRSAIQDIKKYAMKRAKDNILEKVKLVKAALDQDLDLAEIPEFQELTQSMNTAYSLEQPPSYSDPYEQTYGTEGYQESYEEPYMPPRPSRRPPPDPYSTTPVSTLPRRARGRPSFPYSRRGH